MRGKRRHSDLIHFTRLVNKDLFYLHRRAVDIRRAVFISAIRKQLYRYSTINHKVGENANLTALLKMELLHYFSPPPHLALY